MPLSFTPDFQSEYHEVGQVGLVQIGAAPWAIPAGAAGDTVILWLVTERNWVTNQHGDLDVIEQVDSAAVVQDFLTVVKTQELDDAKIYVATGVRIADLDEVHVQFSPGQSGPVGFAIGNFPPGPYFDAGEKVLAGDSDTFTPRGRGVIAGFVVSHFEAGSPLITPPGADYDSDQQDTGFYSFRVFAHEGQGAFALAMSNPSNLLEWAHALATTVGRSRWGSVGFSR